MSADIGSEDMFRLASDILSPDPRNSSFVIHDMAAGGWRRLTLQDRHDEVASLAVQSSVPREVRIHFETAKNLFLYSWFVYRFGPVAELQAYGSLELALKVRLDHRRGLRWPGLASALGEALRSKWISDLGFRRLERGSGHERQFMNSEQLEGDQRVDSAGDEALTAYAQAITEAIPKLRNELAHGSEMLTPNAYVTLEVCCDLINQLFASPTTTASESDAGRG